MNMPRNILICLALVIAGCDTIPAPTGPFSRLIVFGDSLSDTGNILKESGLVPGAPYFEGRFSNGESWVEVFARHYGLEARPSYVGGTNFAQGASSSSFGLANYSGLPLGPNVRQQIELYRGQPDGTELFVVWSGANDLFDVLNGDCSATPDAIADSLFGAIAALYGRGGRQFLVPNMPNLGIVPRYRERSREALAMQLSLELNAALSARLDVIETFPDITVYRLDIESFFAETVANPPAGITNVTDSAWTGSFLGYLGGGQLVENPDAYIFWDSVHPTRAGHGLIAQAAIALIDSELVSPTANGRPESFTLTLPPAVDYWLTWFSLVGQPGGSPNECRF